MLNEWRFVLDGLVHDPGSLIDCVDWIAKKWLLEQFIEAEGINWGDPWLESLDLEYHNLNRKKGLYFDLLQRGRMKRVVGDKRVNKAIADPPADTRAWARSQVMHALTECKARYVVDWDSIYVEEEHYLNIDDPFSRYEDETEDFVAGFGESEGSAE